MRLNIQPVNGRTPEGRLKFRTAQPCMVDDLKRLYDAAWGSGVSITREQLLGKIKNFPEGQIVGFDGDKPVSMVNMMVTSLQHALRPGYARLTGGMTFSTHMPDGIEKEEIWAALCVSIAVSPGHRKGGFAVETLEYAITLAEINGLLAMPYSAPRGFGNARAENHELDIITYLHMTCPSMDYGGYAQRVEKLNEKTRVKRGFTTSWNPRGQLLTATEERFNIYNGPVQAGIAEYPEDHPAMSFEQTAYARFLHTSDAEFLQEKYGRRLTVEDFCLLTGRGLIDPAARLHVNNGARFVRGGDGKITGVFRDSRPEDKASCGYNMVLSYDYHSALGHDFAVGNPFFDIMN